MRAGVIVKFSKCLCMFLCLFTMNIFALDISDKQMEARVNLGKMGLEYNATDFLKSVENSDLIAVKSFVDAELDIKGDVGKAALILAIRNKNEDVINLLISSEVELDLMFKSMSFLAEKNVPIEVKSFIDAILEENVLFIEHFTNIFSPNELYGGEQSFFHIALIGNHDKAVKLMEKKGGKISLDDQFTYDLFVDVAYSGNNYLISYFLNQGVDVNKPDSKGNYAIINAVRGGKVDTVRLLLKNNADLGVKDSNSILAQGYASSSNNDEVYDLFVELGLLEKNKEITENLKIGKYGKSLYMENCSACHQETGVGITGLFPSLITSEISNGDIEELTEFIKKGKAGSLMPGFENTLSISDISAVANYVNRMASGN